MLTELAALSKNYVTPLKNEFYTKLAKLIRRKSNSVFYLNRTKYEELIKEVSEVEKKTSKDFGDFALLANYDVVEVNQRYKLTKPSEDSCLMFYVTVDELFGVIHTMHVLYGHENKELYDKIKTKYCNVSKEAVRIYLSCCKICNSKDTN